MRLHSLAFRRIIGLSVGCVFALELAARVSGQTGVGGQEGSFEVASVKPNRSGESQTELGFQAGGRFVAVNETLKRLIGEAYGPSGQPLPAFRIVGAESWLESDRFDVDARVTGNPPTVERRAELLRALLSNRFQLRVHNETRELPIYFLVRANGAALGPQLRASNVDCGALRAAYATGATPVPPVQSRPCILRFGPGQLSASGLTMSDLAQNALSRFVSRVVVDHTGLSGAFDWILKWAPDQLATGLTGAADNQVSIFTALEEQLGLKLQSQQGPVNVLVVDHAERPTPD